MKKEKESTVDCEGVDDKKEALLYINDKYKD